MGSHAVYLEDIVKRFSDVTAVDHVTLGVESRTFTVLLGPSGCGKTTILRIIAGFYEPDLGEVYISGRRVTQFPPHRRNTGMVFQNYALFPHMSVYDNIAYGLKFRGLTKQAIKERVKATAEMLGIDRLVNRVPAQLSGGEQQRVALARALVIEPDILLLDEPLSNLDAKVRVKVRGGLKRIQRSLGITALHVTHDQEEALSLGDHVILLNRGKVVQEGKPEEVYRSPSTRFVAEFLGNSNVFEASVAEVRETGVVLELPNGMRAIAEPNPKAKLNQRVWVAVRSEHIRRVSGIGGENIFPAVVKDRVFYGPTLRLTVDVKGLEWTVDLEADEQVADNNVMLSINKSDLHILSE